ncbi:MAG: thioredoxin family protein [Prevotellaceae bacterium]|jgi:thiol:disulfide interchange protein DsbD|nr:thioredoxin family protein [Prevotellaceae bacterium]
MKRFFSAFFTLLISLAAFSQEIKNPVEWNVSAKRVSTTEVELSFEAKIGWGWVVYGTDVPEDGPLPISLSMEEGATDGALVEVEAAKIKHDEMFDMDVPYFAGKAHLMQRIKILPDTKEVKGTLEFQACSETECIPLNHDFKLSVPTDITSASVVEKVEGGESLLLFFFIAMSMGFLGVLTPCVFPMLPMTISFFMRNQSRKKGLSQAFIFVASMVVIYTLIGVMATLTKSVAFTTALSAHWLPNIIFFLLFILFAASSFGAFEITLPTSLVNRIDRQADKGGYFAIFFVALALCVVSFSCTGLFVGGLLVAAASGAVLKPVIGMFGFGLAFALPFGVLALFPSVLKKLPKSGGWLNVIKVFCAFVLAIFSMKFLATADQALGFYIISREVFLCIWIVLFTMLGFYFLGKIHFAHDDKVERVGFMRFSLAVAAFAFALYLVTGLLGNNLSAISGFLPAPELTANHTQKGGGPKAVDNAIAYATGALCEVPKYSGTKMRGPAGVPAYFDLEEAIACAKKQSKQLLLDFKGYSCTNCKKMEGEVFAHSQVKQALQDRFVVVALYTDDKTPLPESEWYTSSFDGKVKKTLGQQNMDYLITSYKVNAMPYFAVLNSEGELQGKPVGYVSNPDQFLKFLEQSAN